MNSYEIIEYIAKAKKQTPVKVYIKGKLENINFSNFNFYGNEKFGILFCDYYEFKEFYKQNEKYIEKYNIEIDRHNSKVPLADITKYNARIEPGAIIREHVEIGDNAVIMMGAVINIGAKIGEKTMIDMNAVIGGRAIIGKNCHIGAGAVVAGVIEPPSAKPVEICDNVLLGANSVVLEGITVGEGAIVAAGAVVISDVKPYSVVAGIPAKLIKQVDEKTRDKTKIIDELRNL